MNQLSTGSESEMTPAALPTNIAGDVQSANGGDKAFWRTIVGVAIVSAVVCGLSLAVGPWEFYFRLFFDATWFGQITLAGMWLGLGVTRLAIRLAAAFSVIGLYVALRLLTGLPADYFVLLLLATSLVVGAAALPGFLLRLAGTQVTLRQDTQPASLANDQGRRQFSLLQIFALTTGVAIVAGILRNVGQSAHLENIGRFWYLLPEVAICFCAACIALSDSRSMRWAPVPFALVIGAGLAFYLGWTIAFFAIAEMAAVMLTLLPFRLLGYRMRFRRAGRYFATGLQ